jgi:hypothetical protein
MTLSDLMVMVSAITPLSKQWRKLADESGFEATRIYNTVKVHTDAQERCYARQQVWNQAADQLDAALTVATKPHDDTGDPRHCHACALRAFAHAETRARSADMALLDLRSDYGSMFAPGRLKD